MDERMINPYYYLYYRLYKFAKKVSKWNPAWLAVVWIAGLNFFNIAAFIFLIFPAKKVLIFPPWYISLMTTIPLMVLNYFIFLHKDKSAKIIAHYDNESKIQKLWSAILSILYIVLTLYLAHLK